ncbi:RGG repeats nuclear RNA binding protein A-like [Senna tora]|uniref:RGG repeats nuclear RNA binding protein A-like n=1 Tax=Senna tora TaxID=362788 RepID=A0A835CJW7_9FABA|nr:RGG repeats nuclear RNA binding protein A-like [Senna tora]
MATMNPFDLLGDDAEDPSQLIAAEQQKVVVAAPKKAAAQDKQQNKAAQLPSKPLPPAQAVREARNDNSRGGRGGGRGAGRGYGRGRGFNRDFPNDDNSFSAPRAPTGQGSLEEGDAGKSSERRGYGGPRGSFRGGRRGGFSNGEMGEDGRPRRTFERRSGTGRGSEIKREGSGRGNWGMQTDELAQVTEEVVTETDKNLGDEKPAVEEEVAEGNKDSPANEAEEKEPEDKEMTLEEYEKVLEEKRKALQALKTDEGRKVDVKEFESMQQLSSKKDNHDDIFIKLGSDKDKRKEALEKEEKSKKSVSINEFLKPAEGERYYSGGRGRGRGRGSRGGFGGNLSSNVRAPSIEDPGQFPTLGAK